MTSNANTVMEIFADLKRKIASAEEKGRVQGKAEGSNGTTKNIALNLIKEGTAIEIIAKVTGLSEAVISNLQKTSKCC